MVCGSIKSKVIDAFHLFIYYLFSFSVSVEIGFSSGSNSKLQT